MIRTPKLLPIIAAALVATPATAQDETGDQDIVVEGELSAEAATVRNLVQQLETTHRADVPATRFFDALCVTVSGLNPAGNAFVQERIYDNATAIGLGHQRDGCRANALVLIHDDPRALVEQIKDDVPGLLPRETRGSVEAQLLAGQQVIVWHNEEDRDIGGRESGFHDTMPGDDQVGGSLNVETRMNVNGWPSRTQLGHSRGVRSAVVILDGDIVEGMLIDRLADYSTVRLLAPQLLPLEGEAPEPATITAPFPDEAGPSNLTRFDHAYLTALYSLRPNAPATRLARAVADAYENGE